MPLAFVIDDAWTNWIIGTLAVVIPGLLVTIRRLWIQLIGFVKPMIETLYEKFKGGIDEHRALVQTMENNVPVVAETLKTMSATQGKMAETLDGQSKAIERLDVRHGEHSVKLDTILKTLSRP